MIQVFGVRFVDSWASLSPRYATYDSCEDLSLTPFPKVMERFSKGFGPEESPATLGPIEVQNLMVAGNVLMGYANELRAKIAGLLTEKKKTMANVKTSKLSTMEAKSEAERERKMCMEPDYMTVHWEVEDLENMKEFTNGMFRVLSDLTNSCRSLFYGTQVERRMTPPIEASMSGVPETRSF
jgi:hypothetical protein